MSAPRRVMSTDDIIAIVNRVGKPGLNGHLAALRRGFTSALDLTPAQRDFLAAVAKTPPSATVSGYVHPDTNAAAPGDRAGKDPSPLSPADVAWIQRLPADPEQVTFDDAALTVADNDK